MKDKHETISLAEVVDRLTEMEQQGEFLTTAQRHQTVRTLAQFYSGAQPYLGFYIPSYDLTHGGRLFTGERLRTHAGLNMVLSLEVCRTLLMLDGFKVEIAAIIAEVNRRVQQTCFAKDGCVNGECAISMLAFWRYLLAAGWNDGDARMEAFLTL